MTTLRLTSNQCNYSASFLNCVAVVEYGQLILRWRESSFEKKTLKQGEPLGIFIANLSSPKVDKKLISAGVWAAAPNPGAHCRAARPSKYILYCWLFLISGSSSNRVAHFERDSGSIQSGMVALPHRNIYLIPIIFLFLY